MKIIITESQYSALTRRYASSIPIEELVNTFLDFLGVKKSETFDDFYSKVKKHVMFRIKHDMLMKDMLDTTDYVNNKLNSLTQKIENDVHSYIDDNLKDKIEDYYNRHSKKTSKKKSNLNENDDDHKKKELPNFIKRRFTEDELDFEFYDALDYAKGLLNNTSIYSRTERTLENYIRVTISVLMDNLHAMLTDRLPQDVQWYETVENALKDYYRDEITKEYKSMNK